MSADGLRFDGERIVVCSGSEEYRLVIDRSCPVTRTSCSTPPDDFERLSDPDALALYLQERPHTRTPLALDMRVQQMQIVQERTPATSSGRRQERPLYERSNRLTNRGLAALWRVARFLGSEVVGHGDEAGDRSQLLRMGDRRHGSGVDRATRPRPAVPSQPPLIGAIFQSPRNLGLALDGFAGEKILNGLDELARIRGLGNIEISARHAGANIGRGFRRARSSESPEAFHAWDCP